MDHITRPLGPLVVSDRRVASEACLIRAAMAVEGIDGLIVYFSAAFSFGFLLLGHLVFSRMTRPFFVIPHRRQPAMRKQYPGFVLRIRRALM